MTHGFNSSNTSARPSHHAIEKAPDSLNYFKNEREKLDNLAMRGARKAQNRLVYNEERIPGSTIFSK